MLNDKIKEMDSRLHSLEAQFTILDLIMNDNSEVKSEITQNKVGKNMLKDILGAQILEIEAQLKIKNSERSDLESKMNHKVQSFQNDKNPRKKMQRPVKKENRLQ